MILTLFFACHTAWDEADVDGLRLLTLERPASPSGRLVVDVDIDPSETSLILSADTDGDHITFFSRIWSPDGEEVWTGRSFWDAPRNRTTAPFASSTSVLLWPMDADADPLTPGRWRFDIRTDQENERIQLAVVLKGDTTPDDGLLKVDIYASERLPAALLDGVDGALDHWQDNIALPIGMDLELTRFPADIATTLTRPGGADGATYRALAAARAIDHVPIVLLEDVTDSPTVLGIAGNIPGPMTATARTAVAIDLTEGAGRDGRFSAAEIRLLGETMAHEVSHFLGLFHPVELPDGDRADHWDALSDTPECNQFTSCIEEFSSNLMFPAPVCAAPSGSSCGDFLPQTDLTVQQARTAHAYPAVRD